MAFDATNNSPSCRSYYQKTVSLHDWWLAKPETDDHTKTLGVAGLTCTSQESRAERCFFSAPILKAYDFFELETVDDVCIILQGYINKDRTLENGFSPEVFNHFVIGFPPYWEEFSTSGPEKGSAATVLEDRKDSIEGNVDFHDNSNGKQQRCDKDIIKARHEVLGERSPVTSEFADDPSLGMSPIVRNAVDTCTGSKSLGVSSRRMTRSMTKMDINKKKSLIHDISNLDKVTLINPENLGNCNNSRTDKNLGKNKDADVSDQSQIHTVRSDLEGNDDIIFSRKNLKACQNKRENSTSRVDVPQKEGAPALHGIDSKEATVTQRKTKSKPTTSKREHITSPKSAKSTLRAKKGSEKRYERVNILSPESFSGKKSRSGRVLLPTLQFWRNQKVVYDADRQVRGVEEPM